MSKAWDAPTLMSPLKNDPHQLLAKHQHQGHEHNTLSVRVYFLSLLVVLRQNRCSFQLILFSYIVSLTANLKSPISIPLWGRIELHS